MPETSDSDFDEDSVLCGAIVKLVGISVYNNAQCPTTVGHCVGFRNRALMECTDEV